MNKEFREAMDDWSNKATEVLSKVASGQGATKWDCDELLRLQKALEVTLEQHDGTKAG